MTPDEYMRACERTWNTGDGLDAQLCNAALGLVGELGEFSREPCADELGDVWYYLATLVRLLGLDWQWYGSNVRDFDRAMAHACRVAELVKKIAFHGVDPEEVDHEMGQALYMVMGHLSYRGCLLGFSDGAVMQQNVEKLRKRYPDGFE